MGRRGRGGLGGHGGGGCTSQALVTTSWTETLTGQPKTGTTAKSATRRLCDVNTRPAT